MPDLADHAYAHACALLGPGDPATEAALAAVRRGGRSRWAVLGHARHAALERAGTTPPPDLDAPAPEDLGELAVALAATRAPRERAVIDLDTRHRLDRGGFAHALGLPVGAAGALAAEVFLLWEQTLDPVVLARLGPGGCDGLASVLGAPAPEAEDGVDSPAAAPTLRELLERGPAVADHAAGCATCRDRLRSMVSVRTLTGQRPLEVAPAVVRAAASSARLRRPTLPPPLEPAGAVHRWARPALSVAAAVAFALAGGVVASAVRNDPGPESIEALTQVPESGSSLLVRPSSVSGPLPPPVTLDNRSPREVSWEAQPDMPWLLVTPRRGVLEAGSAADIRLAVSADAPEGEARGAVRFSGADGSVTVVRLTATVEHPPDVAAVVSGCTVTATVEDEGQVRSVELHRREQRPGGRGAEHTTAMDAGTDTYTARLGNVDVPQTWWVTAVDARGNAARTPDQTLPANACP